MCKQGFDLHFCTCMNGKNIVHNKKSRRNKKKLEGEDFIYHNLKWRLNRYKGQNDSGMIGMMIMPKYRFTTALTADYVLGQLNSKNRFDFEYTPTEGDNLSISIDYSSNKKKKHLFSYMSFIFKSGEWVEDYYNAFSDETEEFQKGKVKIINL